MLSLKVKGSVSLLIERCQEAVFDIDQPFVRIIA